MMVRDPLDLERVPLPRSTIFRGRDLPPAWSPDPRSLSLNLTETLMGAAPSRSFK